MRDHTVKTLRLDDAGALARALGSLPGAAQESRDQAAARQAELTKPPGSLGRLEDLALWLAGWQRRAVPRLDAVHCLVFAGNHGVARRGVSAYPADVTAQMVRNFESGGAAINQLCRLGDAALRVVPLDLSTPTSDLATEDAMSDAECAAAMQVGADAVPDECDLLLLGEMGIGNTTPAAALSLATFGGTAADWVGRGTGVDDDALNRKRGVVEEAANRVAGAERTAFARLRQLGGRELAAIAGAVVAARHRSVPVLLDGFVATAAAAPLEAERPGALDHTRVSHVSAESGHPRLAAKLEKRPLLDLDMRLGEASGAAVALLLLRAAVVTHAGMATFGEAGVSNRDA